MNRSDFLELYRYNDWANDRVSNAVTALPGEAFTRHLGGSHPSIRETFAHLIGAEWIWLERWLGNKPTARPDWYASPDASALAAHLRDLQARRATFLDGLDETRIESLCSFAYLSGKPDSQRLHDLLFHVVNHSTFHRGQIVSMLRQVGATPPATDFTEFCAAGRS